MAQVLWSKGDPINKIMHELTVGNDPLFDKELVIWDCIGSGAHARMLEKIGVLKNQDLELLLKGLKEIYELGREGKFDISPDLEDVHTAIETSLYERIGEPALRVHTGRSRNDQVCLATRLYSRDALLTSIKYLLSLTETIFERYDEVGRIPMPGYTHMQRAMPSTVGMWLHAFIEGSLSLLREGLFLIEEVNSNPLGSAAGFGSPIPLDRKYTAELMSFSRVQRSVIDVNNSRGKAEEKILRWGSDICWLFEKFACDVMLYQTTEFQFISFPPELTTGSSIMPQKQNIDLAELLRARGSKVRAGAYELSFLTAKLPSSYHRDLQYTKEPFIRGHNELIALIRMATLLINSFKPNEKKMREAMDNDLYATYGAYRLVKNGKPFRTAYREIAEEVKNNTFRKDTLERDFEHIEGESGASVEEARDELRGLISRIDRWDQRLEQVPKLIFG
jgi:argininosuccinate lyase